MKTFMQNITRLIFCVLIPGLVPSAGRVCAQTSYPMVMSVSPVAAQTGTTSTHTVESRYSMFGAYRVLVSGNGVAGTVVTEMKVDKDGKEPALTRVDVDFTVTEDALPGVRDFRLIGPTGATTLGQLVIVRDPVVSEDIKNDTVESAQDIPLPVTICGCVEKTEDVDFYRFRVAEEATLIFHCRGMRLEDRIHDLQTHVDPILTLRSAETGSTINAVDNFYAADPFMEQKLSAGEYLLEVRDVRYSGNRYWNYAIEINDRPFIQGVHPQAVTRGQAAELQLVGANLPEQPRVSWSAPSDLNPCVVEVELPLPRSVSNPVSVVVAENPVVSESVEANDNLDQAQVVPVPSLISGRISGDSDIDWYRFDASKGDRLSFEVRARRNQSGLDSIIRILDSNGKRLVENDDMRILGRMTVQDSQVENWVAPADGSYVLEIRDVHLRGGDSYFYSINVERAVPGFELVLDSDKSWLTPGTSAALFARVVRKNGFDGEVQLHVEGLPEGVTASCGRILAGKGADGCIVLSAADDARMAASNILVYGTAVASGENGEPYDLKVSAQPMQETYMPGGGRNHWPVDMHTVAVGRPADLLGVELDTYDLTLKPGESKTVNVEISRAEGFAKNVTLDMLYQHLSSKYANTLPEGVTIDAKSSVTLLTGEKSSGAITLTAAAAAPPVTKHQCCVMANVSINFVMKATYCSKPLLVSVVPE